MVQLIKSYDSTLHEKILILKGEEAYVRTTDCILEEITYSTDDNIDSETGRRKDWNKYLESMALEFRVKVLRNIGASQIVLYDNDEVLDVVDYNADTEYVEWKYNNINNDNRIRLAYDVEHNFYAKYMGNKQCLKSQSKTYSFNEPIPDAYDSVLRRYNDLTVRYSPVEQITVPIEFVSGEVFGTEQTKTVELYIDNVSQGTKDIIISANSSSGNTLFTVNRLDVGLHTINVVFNGDEFNSRAELSYNISVGYQIAITSSPSFAYNQQDVNITAKITDYFNNSVQCDTVKLYSRLADIKEISTDSEGRAIFNLDYWDLVKMMSPVDDITYCAYKIEADFGKTFYKVPSSMNKENSVDVEYVFLGDEDDDYDPFDIYTYIGFKYYDGVTVNLSSDTLIVAKGKIANLTAMLNSNYEDLPSIPITFSGGINGTYNTNNNAVVKYTGTGAGDTIITAKINNSFSNITIEDCLMYYNSSREANVLYEINSNTNVQKLTNGLKISRKDTTNPSSIKFYNYHNEFADSRIRGEFSFKVVNGSERVKINNSYNYTPKSNDTVRIVNYPSQNDNWKVEIFVNDVSQYIWTGTESSQDNFNNRRIPYLAPTENITINDIKWKVIE